MGGGSSWEQEVREVREVKEISGEIGLVDVISVSSLKVKGCVVIYVQEERKGKFFIRVCRFYRVR